MFTRSQQREFASGVESLAGDIRKLARPLETPADLDPLLERIGSARYVLLGEASHGTSEYYTWRAHLTKRLILENGFSFLAVEGDWPDCYALNRYIKGYPNSGESAWQVLHAFHRWPTWMWANWEIAALAEWLKKHNESVDEARKVGFYGLDVYSLHDSMNEVLRYLERVDGSTVNAARKAMQCFEPYAQDAVDYARSTLWAPEGCTEEVITLLGELRRKAADFRQDGREGYFAAEQNALIVQNAERYYRTMIRGGPESWNVRDRHMVETLERLMQQQGTDARAVVWEHNTHIGDARATDMSAAGMVNVGQLVRETHKAEEVVLAGFGCYEGTVIAGYEWGAPMRRMPVPPARGGSWEEALRRAGEVNKLLILEDAPESFRHTRGHRAIGVVYDPEYERYGNYVPTRLSDRYDAFLYVDRTEALHPLHIDVENAGEPPETYPWNV